LSEGKWEEYLNYFVLQCIVIVSSFFSAAAHILHSLHILQRESHCCRVAGNTVWSHMACDFP